MRAITKGPEPPSLTAHRQMANCDYENYEDKEGLRNSLITEQRGLCCYCMGRIRNGPTVMKIEHWQSQTRYPAEQLKYHNLLGACLGGGRQPPKLQHCDTCKGKRDLRFNPAEPNHHIETRIWYGADGSIGSEEADFNTQLSDVLNLNLRVLQNSRKGMLDAIIDWWKKEKARLHGPVPRSLLERERNRRIGGTGELQPYCRVAVWWLEQRLARIPT
ncbi:MAG: TIGR02646 family protein [Syntrophobacteraceae bacterium]